MRDDHELSGRGDDGHVVALLGLEPAEEHAQGTRVLRDLLGGLRQQPPGLRVAGLGDASVVAGVGRLAYGSVANTGNKAVLDHQAAETSLTPPRQRVLR